MRPCPSIHQVTLKETGYAHGVLRLHIGLSGTSTAAQTARPHGLRHHKAYQCDACNGCWAAARDKMVLEGYTETRRYATSNTLRLLVVVGMWKRCGGLELKAQHSHMQKKTHGTNTGHTAKTMPAWEATW